MEKTTTNSEYDCILMDFIEPINHMTNQSVLRISLNMRG